MNAMLNAAGTPWFDADLDAVLPVLDTHDRLLVYAERDVDAMHVDPTTWSSRRPPALSATAWVTHAKPAAGDQNVLLHGDTAAIAVTSSTQLSDDRITRGSAPVPARSQ